MVAAALICVPGSAHGLGSRTARVRDSWCQARPSSAWLQVLSRHVVGLSRRRPLVPFALAHDGRSFFAAVYSPRFSGVAEIDSKTSRVTQIKAFADPAEDQADGAFDGRRLVWSEYHSLSDPDDFTVWTWDSRPGRVRQIGAATRAADGEFWPSPLRAPDARDGVATWGQGIGPEGLSAIHVYNLRTGRGAIVHRGHAQGSFIFGRRLVGWPESPGPGRLTRMRAASALTGKRRKVPPALRTLYGVSGLATDGRRIAYPSAQYRSLWWSPSLRRKPRRVVTARSHDRIDNSVQVGGRYVAFGISPRLFVADTKSRRYLQIGHSGGWMKIDDTTLLVAFGSPKKVIHPRLRISVVPLGKLPAMPACA